MQASDLAVMSDGQWAALAGVVVAALGGIVTVLVALISRPAKAAAKDAAQKAEVVAKAVGTPNGKGNVVQMSEEQLKLLGEQQTLLTRIAVDLADLGTAKTNEHNALRGDMQAGLAGVSTKLGDVVDAMDHHGARIGRIEKHLALPDLPKEPA